MRTFKGPWALQRGRYRNQALTAESLSGLIAEQQVAALAIGHRQSPLLYILPIAAWRANVEGIYQHGQPVRVSRWKMTEKLAVDITVHQVDSDWQPHAYGIITENGVDVAYLVPANEYWQQRVEETEQ